MKKLLSQGGNSGLLLSAGSGDFSDKKFVLDEN
jgi:hypothetical protein